MHRICQSLEIAAQIQRYTGHGIPPWTHHGRRVWTGMLPKYTYPTQGLRH